MIRHLSGIILVGILSPSVAYTQTEKRRAEPRLTTDGGGSPVVIVTLSFNEFFAPGGAELKPSDKLLALNGKHVRMVGFMVQMEDPPLGVFYLCPRPVFADEEGGGTADLPPETLLVIMPSSAGKKISFIPGALEVAGTLEVTRREMADGRISFVNLVLDKSEARPAKASATHLKRNRR